MDAPLFEHEVRRCDELVPDCATLPFGGAVGEEQACLERPTVLRGELRRCAAPRVRALVVASSSRLDEAAVHADRHELRVDALVVDVVRRFRNGLQV